MRVLFINMPVRTAALPNNVPLGIYYVGAAIRRSMPDVEVGYLDLNVYRPPPDTRDLLRLITPADVFMLSGLITTLAWQEACSRVIRKLYPAAIIVSGGGLASNIGRKLLSWLPLDSVVRGEGEGVAPKVLRDILDAGRPHEEYQGEPMNLNELPGCPWRDVEGLETYIGNPVWGAGAQNSSYTPFTMKRSVNYVATRGCPFDCAFCNRDVLGGRNYRVPTVKNLVVSIHSIAAALNLDFIGLTDDNFMANRAYVDAFCSEMTGYAPLNWGCHARFDECDDHKTMRLLKLSGCKYLGFGGESANRDILASMNKKNDPDQMARVIAACRDAGIHPNATWIMGWPGETRAQIRETARFILKYAPENRSMFVATAYPNTALWDMVQNRIYDRFGTLEAYVRQLGDATLPVMNHSAMRDQEFMEVRALIEDDRLEDI